jgi:putative flippase GtrA
MILSSPTLKSGFFQIVRYTLAGGAAIVTHLAILSLLIELTQINKTLASAIGFACAIPVNYLLQHFFVFHSSGAHGIRFARYILVTLSVMMLNALFFWILAEVLKIQYVIAQLITTALVFTINFVSNRSYTFSNLDRRDSVNDAAYQRGENLD